MNSPMSAKRNKTLKLVLRALALMLPILLISAFIVFQPSSGAQTTECPNNLVRNGNFTQGVVVVGNGNFPPSTVPSWTSAFGSPQAVSALPGCGDPNFIRMWGNKVVGEGIRQTVNIQQGRTYRLSACVKWVPTNNNPPLPQYVRFNVRASNGPINYTDVAPVAPTIGIIGDPTNTPSVSPPGITSTTWTTVRLANWIAPANFNTLTINPENNSLNNSPAEVSWGDIDNICLQEVFPPDFVPLKTCQGQATQFTPVAPNATSWNWDFGSATSTQQTPTHTFAIPGTHPVELCVNGMNDCVTKSVIVGAAPPAPVISGPNIAFGNQTATYSVPFVPGVSYSWTVSGGVFNGPSTGPTVSVTWGPNGGGVIAVTAKNKGGCSSITRMVVGNHLPSGECCHGFKVATTLASFSHTGNGVYNFGVALSVNQSNIIRVTANIISSSLTFSSPACGTAGPVNSYVMSASPVGNFQPTVLVPNGDEVSWNGPPAGVSSVFPMQIKFPPPPTGSACRDFLSFCVKYTFSDSKCKTCEVIRCYGPYKRGGKIEVFSEFKDPALTP